MTDSDIWLVAECYVDQYGPEGAIAELNDRRPEKAATAAIAHIKREYQAVVGDD